MTKERSILIRFTPNRRNAAIEAWPVPKSSRSMRHPISDNALMLRTIVSSAMSVTTVSRISTVRRSGRRAIRSSSEPAEVHADLRDDHPGGIPRLDRRECMIRHDFCQPFQQPGLLDGRQEFGGRDCTPMRVNPACQRLEPSDPAGVGGNLRLEPGLHMPALEGTRDFVAQIGALFHTDLQLGRVGAHGARAPLLCLVQGGDGGSGPVLPAVPGRAPQKAEAHAGRDI